MLLNHVVTLGVSATYKMSYLVRSNVTYGTMMKLRYSIGSGMKVFMA